MGYIPHFSRRARRRASTLLTIAATLAIAVPMSVFASDTFTDVAPGNQFHPDINKIADAGITTGCGGGNYCPSSSVTRAQMAAFMSRGFGVSGGTNNSTTVSEAVDEVDVLTLDFRTPGITGGTGYIAVTVEGTVLGTSSECPCTMIGQLGANGVYQGTFNLVALQSEGAPFLFGTASFDMIGGTWLLEVPTNTTISIVYEAMSIVSNAVDSELSFIGSMTAVYTPFNSGGTTELSSASSNAAERLQVMLSGN